MQIEFSWSEIQFGPVSYSHSHPPFLYRRSRRLGRNCSLLHPLNGLALAQSLYFISLVPLSTIVHNLFFWLLNGASSSERKSQCVCPEATKNLSPRSHGCCYWLTDWLTVYFSKTWLISQIICFIISKHLVVDMIDRFDLEERLTLRSRISRKEGFVRAQLRVDVLCLL